MSVDSVEGLLRQTIWLNCHDDCDADIEWREGLELDVARLPLAFSALEVEQLHAVGAHPSSVPMQDRSEDIEEQSPHTVRRCEKVLQIDAPSLYSKLRDIIAAVDNSRWHALQQAAHEECEVYPEIEVHLPIYCLELDHVTGMIAYAQYIEYDTEMHTLPTIAKHVDNGSVITAIVMLSESADFEVNPNSTLTVPRYELTVTLCLRGEPIVLSLEQWCLLHHGGCACNAVI